MTTKRNQKLKCFQRITKQKKKQRFRFRHENTLHWDCASEMRCAVCLQIHAMRIQNIDLLIFSFIVRFGSKKIENDGLDDFRPDSLEFNIIQFYWPQAILAISEFHFLWPRNSKKKIKMKKNVRFLGRVHLVTFKIPLISWMNKFYDQTFFKHTQTHTHLTTFHVF